MSVKEALFNFLTKFIEWHEKKHGFRPADSGIPDIIYDGPFEKGYAFWKPVEIKETFDFKCMEDKIGFKIHNDLKEFLTSYYYYRASAALGQYYVSLRRSIPKFNPVQEVYGNISGAIEMGFDPQYIDFADAEVLEIGVDSDYYLVIFHNVTGKIYLHEQHAKTQDNMVYLAASMEEFLNKLTSDFDKI